MILTHTHTHTHTNTHTHVQTNTHTHTHTHKQTHTHSHTRTSLKSLSDAISKEKLISFQIDIYSELDDNYYFLSRVNTT
jgi:hypothetical protein